MFPRLLVCERQAAALQGLGYAFFFVPLTMIAYSQLKPDQNNKASSITNFFRKLGRKLWNRLHQHRVRPQVGISSVRRGGNHSGSSPSIQQQIKSISQYLTVHGMRAADAPQAAYGFVYSRLEAQVHLLAFMDCFHVLGVITVVAAPIVLLTRRFAPGGKPIQRTVAREPPGEKRPFRP